LKHPDEFTSAAFSPYGRHLVTTKTQTVHLWDAVKGVALRSPLTVSGQYGQAVFSPDGRRVGVGSKEGYVQVYHLDTKSWNQWLMKHDGPVRQAAFSPDSSRLVTASGDGTVRVWDTVKGSALVPPLRHSKPVVMATFSPDGRRVLTASADGTARLWDLATGDISRPPFHHTGAVYCASFSPDGRRVVTASADRTARVWDTSTGKPLTVSLKHDGAVLWVSFSPQDGRHVLTASNDKTARLWKMPTGDPEWVFRHDGAVVAASFCSSGSRVVTSSRDRTARVWDVRTGKAISGPLKHDFLVKYAELNADGTRVVTASFDQTARLWDADRGVPLGLPMRHEDYVRHAAFSPDGRLVVTASYDQTARVWDAATGKPVSPLLRHNNIVYEGSFSPDSQSVATFSMDGTARLWETVTGALRTPPLKHPNAVSGGRFSPDGRLLVTTSSTRVHLWDAATGEPISPPLKHGSYVHDAAFRRDGRLLVTASGSSAGGNGMARIWDVSADDRPVEDLLALCEVLSGQRIVDGRVVPIETGDLHSLWQRLRPSYPQQFLPSPAEVLAWHRWQPEQLALSGQWQAALFHLDRLIAAEPADWSHHAGRGQAYLELRQWSKAVADLSTAIKLHPDARWLREWRGYAAAEQGQWTQAAADHDAATRLRPDHPRFVYPKALLVKTGDHQFWYRHAQLCLRVGNVAGYRKACATMLKRFGQSEDPEVLALVLWTCVLAPNAVADPAALVRLAEHTLSLRPDTSEYHLLLGAALYRAGRLKEAIAHLDKAVDLASEPGLWQGSFLIMAHHRLGNAGDAKYWREKCAGWYRFRFTDESRDATNPSSPWHERLYIQLLYREAREVAGEGKK
jgi:WD40 repeat protein/tetratricopeptide (TPR) repeat protein